MKEIRNVGSSGDAVRGSEITTIIRRQILRRWLRCKKCGKNHMETCLKGKNVYYNCGYEGHITLNCPNLKNRGCYTCRATNHLVRNCPNKRTNVEKIKIIIVNGYK